MERKTAPGKKCSDFSELPAKDRDKLQRTVQDAADSIDRTLANIGLDDCRVEEILFAKRQRSMLEDTCTMKCEVVDGRLKCVCME